MRLFSLCVALLAFSTHAQDPKLPCAQGDKACAREVLKRHPARQAEFWKAALAKPVEQRIGAAPAELIEILTLDNVVHGYPNKPRAPHLTPRFLADVRQAFAGIPEAVLLAAHEMPEGAPLLNIPPVLPEAVVVDNGMAFLSREFLEMCARLEIGRAHV